MSEPQSETHDENLNTHVKPAWTEQQKADYEALRIAKHREGKERQKLMGAEKRAIAKQNRLEEKKEVKTMRDLEIQQQIDYPKLKPEDWFKKYGTEKPKIGLIDHETAVKLISRRMTHVALHTLAEVCQHSKNDAARVSAAREILDRGWGKAHLQPEATTSPGSEITVVFGNKGAMAKVIDHRVGEETDETDDTEAEDAENENAEAEEV